MNATPASLLTAAQRRSRVELIRRQIELMRRYSAETGDAQHARWLLKEVIYRVWEQPQIPPPRFDKYSLWFAWSPRALERLASYAQGGKRPDIKGLRLEHVIPRGILADELLARERDDLASFLDAFFKAAVITVEDDAQLNQAGVRARMPEGWELGSNPWVRYEHAGLNPASFEIPCRLRPELAL